MTYSVLYDSLGKYVDTISSPCRFHVGDYIQRVTTKYKVVECVYLLNQKEFYLKVVEVTEGFK